jgi:hypothetical protein
MFLLACRLEFSAQLVTSRLQLPGIFFVLVAVRLEFLALADWFGAGTWR